MTTAIAEYSRTEAALGELRQKYEGATFDVTSTDGMKQAREARAELRQWRVDLEKERVRIKKPALDRAKAIDTEAKRITAELTALEDPIDAQIKEETGRKQREKEEAERAERGRIESIRAKISDLERWPLAMFGCDSAKISTAIKSLDAMPITAEAFAEFTDEAAKIHGESLRKVRELYVSTLEAEKQKAEIERMRAEQDAREAADRERLAAEARARAAEIEARAKEEAEARRKIEEAERASRAKIEAEERAARQKLEEEERKARAKREAEEAKARAEAERIASEERAIREKAEEAERAKLRAEAAVADAREMLQTFVDRFGEIAEFAKVVKSIRTYLGQSHDRT